MINYWYKDFPQYPRGHIDFWRVRLVFHLMLLMTLLFMLLAVINFFMLASPVLGAIDIAGAVFSLVIYVVFRKTGNINLAAWVSTVMVITLVLLFIYIVGGQSNSFLWATLVPPVAFFLLGKQWGSVLTALTLSFCCYIAFTLYQDQPDQDYTIGSVLNIIEVSIAHILMFRFYEGTRSEAYNELNRNHQKIQVLAETDKLTGLFNRDKLDDSLHMLIDANLQQDTSLALLIIDIDHFKQINDEDGHLVGDKVLQILASRLQSNMRTNDLLARWGGEEFVVVLPNTPHKAALDLSKRLLGHVASETIEGRHITISVGATQYYIGDSSETLLSRADKALYQAKEEGRNRVVSILS